MNVVPTNVMHLLDYAPDIDPLLLKFQPAVERPMAQLVSATPYLGEGRGFDRHSVDIFLRYLPSIRILNCWDN